MKQETFVQIPAMLRVVREYFKCYINKLYNKYEINMSINVKYTNYQK